MRSLYVFPSSKRPWRVAPLPAVKYGLISLIVVSVLLFAIDRIVLKPSGDEQYWLKPDTGWLRHNDIVREEILKGATTDAFPGQPKMRFPAAGVVSWAGHPVSPEKPPGMKRILVMGDSFVSGPPYLTRNHMWWRQLGQLLEENSIEVIAVGRAGASTRDELKWARYFVPRYKPDLIIWGYVVNDPDEGRIPEPRGLIPADSPFYSAWQLVRKALPRIAATLENHGVTKLYFAWQKKLLEAENLAVYEQTLRELKAFMDESKIPGFMVTLPILPSSEVYGPMHAPVLKVWKDAGLSAHDTIPAFVERYGEAPARSDSAVKWSINPADWHPGPKSCRFLAEQAAEIVRRDYPQLLGEKRRPTGDAVINDWLPAMDASDTPRWDAVKSAWTMRCPSDEKRFPSMPLGIPTPMLAFKNPVALDTIKVAGPQLESAQVWVSCLDREGHFDDGIPHDLGKRSGPEVSWDLPADISTRPVSVILFRAEFSGPNREMAWSFVSGKEADQ